MTDPGHGSLPFELTAHGRGEGKPSQSTAPHVFISYARANRPQAQQLAQALGGYGLRVWWDSDLATGDEFAAVIEAQLQGAGTVIVLWSAHSVRSAFVRDECTRAMAHGKLLPVRIEAAVALPLGFGQLHTLDLSHWRGSPDDAAFQKLLHEVKARQERPQAHRGGPAPLPATAGRQRSHAWPRLPLTAMGAALLLGTLIAAGAYQHRATSQAQAETHFRAGLGEQFARFPQLEKALNEYLSALERRPQHGRAHYYLGHVYAQMGQPAAALGAFELALQALEAPLDAGQRRDASQQRQALTAVPGEASALHGEPSAPARPVGAPARQPPHIPPTQAASDVLASSVQALFSLDAETRISATTRLVLEPQLLSDAVPLAVQQALQALQNNPTELPTRQSAGVINTLVLLQNALAATLQSNRPAIEQLLALAEPLNEATQVQARKLRGLLEQASARGPVAHIQITSEAQRPVARALAERLQTFGYQPPFIERINGSRAPAQTQLRVQGKSERSHARWIAKLVGNLVGTPIDTLNLRNAQPTTDTYEIWLARDLCAPAAPPQPACAILGLPPSTHPTKETP
jgi:tetratricopeptide (TPR) repeat protein